MGRRTEHFLKRKYRWPRGTRKDAWYHSHRLEWPTSKRTQITNIGEDVEKRIYAVWWESKLVQQLLWKTVWKFLKKLKTEIPYDPAIPLLSGISGYISEKNYIYIHILGYLSEKTPLIKKDTCPLMFMASLFTIAKIWKQPQCPEDMVYISHTHTNTHRYNGLLLSLQRMNFCYLQLHEWTWKALS